MHGSGISHSRRELVLVPVIGLTTGVLTQLGQGVLPDTRSPIANAISPWLAVAFLVGALMPRQRWAAVTAATALLLALVGYYVMTEIRLAIGASTGSLVRWVSGP